LEFINEIEERFDVQNWMVEGMHIWPILRINLAFQLDSFVVKQSNVKFGQSIKAAVKKGTKIPLGLIKHMLANFVDYKNNDHFKREVDALFITYPSTRRIFSKNGWFDIYCDPFIDLFTRHKIDSAVLEYSPDFNYKIPRFNKSIFIQPKLTFLSYLNGLTSKKIQISSKNMDDLKLFFDYLISRKMEAYIPDLFFVRLRTGYIRKLANYLKRIFVKMKPSMVLGSNYYGCVEMAASFACRELGITSVDIQHGIQGDFHAAYGRWNKVPGEGYELLPDLFWNWSNEDKKTISKWNTDVKIHHQSIVGGNLLLDFFSKKDNDIIKEYDSKIQNIIKDIKKKIHILISLQTGRGFLELYRDALKESPQHFFWWIRFHPLMTNAERKKAFDIIKTIKTIKKKNVNIEEASNLPLYLILRKMDIHVTENSTIVREAEQFGVPSVITHPSGRSFFQKQIRSGIAVFAESSQNLIKSIENQSKKKYPKIGRMNDAESALKELLSYVKNKKIGNNKR
jgi:hypothetical protein